MPCPSGHLFPQHASQAQPLLEKTVLFAERTDGFTLYRIPGIVVTSKGSVLAYCEARKFSDADRGEIEIHLRRSTDGGKTFAPAKQVAHLGPRLPRNPHMSSKKEAKDLGGPDEQTVNNPIAITTRGGYGDGNPTDRPLTEWAMIADGKTRTFVYETWLDATWTAWVGWENAPLATLHAADAPKPNILVILTDDMGYADIGAHGCKDIPTPNIDRIAARGVSFAN